MPEPAGEETPQDNLSLWPVNEFTNFLSTKQIQRKIINSAIYVERPLTPSASSENASICQKYSNEDLTDLMMLRTKRCTCSTDPKTCLCHISRNRPLKSEPVRSLPVMGTESRPKIIRSSLSSGIKAEDKEAAIKSWLTKKEDEKKAKMLREKKLKQALEKQKQTLAEQEQRNFQMWLENKKKAEIEAKKKKEREKEILKLEKEKKDVENKLSFLLWVKKKEEQKLESKIKEQMKVIDQLEERRKKMERNEKAFQQWIENSKSRPKPEPLSQGLRSWSSSSSVSFFNPLPWKSAA